MTNLSSVARCAASPNNLRATVRVTATSDALRNVTDSEFEPARRARFDFSASQVTDAREYLFVPAPAEAATAQVSVPSLL